MMSSASCLAEMPDEKMNSLFMGDGKIKTVPAPVVAADGRIIFGGLKNALADWAMGLGRDIAYYTVDTGKRLEFVLADGHENIGPVQPFPAGAKITRDGKEIAVQSGVVFVETKAETIYALHGKAIALVKQETVRAPAVKVITMKDRLHYPKDPISVYFYSDDPRIHDLIVTRSLRDERFTARVPFL